MSNEGKEMKITDRRMFTSTGELREEYRFLDEKSNAPAPDADASGSAETGDAGDPGGHPPGIAAPPGAATAPGAASREAAASTRGFADGAPAAYEAPDPHAGGSARLELPGSPPGLGPSFYDLAAVLAEPIPVYLGDVDLPDGQSAENIEMARLYIDLLDVLRQKTAGNLTSQEAAFLEDLLYRSRVRYVQKRG